MDSLQRQFAVLGYRLDISYPYGFPVYRLHNSEGEEIRTYHNQVDVSNKFREMRDKLISEASIDSLLGLD